jgi:ribosomal-protein-alanine N-acetyltransferase
MIKYRPKNNYEKQVRKIEYRINMRKFAENDFQEYFKLVSNEKVMKMITGEALSLEKAEKRYKNLLAVNKLHQSFGSFIVFEKESGEFIGYGKIIPDSETKTEAEVGYMLMPEYWGRGYAAEITKILLEKAEKTGMLKKLTAIIDPENTASKNVLLKNGFISEKFSEIDGLPGEILGKKL